MLMYQYWRNFGQSLSNEQLVLGFRKAAEKFGWEFSDPTTRTGQYVALTQKRQVYDNLAYILPGLKDRKLRIATYMPLSDEQKKICLVAYVGHHSAFLYPDKIPHKAIKPSSNVGKKISQAIDDIVRIIETSSAGQ
jgi:hypothetical protein